MKIKEILNTTEHRPWTMPDGNWKFYQEWNDAIFLHWPVNKIELKKLVPEGIEIDLFEGKSWVSVVAFTMEKIRPRFFPPLAPISNFHEINIRTYVRHKEKAGVYFLSIEGGRKISCHVARMLSELPYRYSKMNRADDHYRSTNSEYNDNLDLEFKVGKKINEKSELDIWLTERYALFQDGKQGINEFEIQHVEWPVFHVDMKEIKVEYPRFNTLFNGLPELCRYSSGVQVLAWDKKKY